MANITITILNANDRTNEEKLAILEGIKRNLKINTTLVYGSRPDGDLDPFFSISENKMVFDTSVNGWFPAIGSPYHYYATLYDPKTLIDGQPKICSTLDISVV